MDGFLYLAKTGHEFLKYQTVDDKTRRRRSTSTTMILDEAIREAGAWRASPTTTSPPTARRWSTGPGPSTGSSTPAPRPRSATARCRLTDVDDQGRPGSRSSSRSSTRRGGSSATGSTTLACTASTGRRSATSTAASSPFCGNRSDLNYLIGEMIGELNIGHTYVYGGDYGDRGDRVRVGLLGVDFDSSTGRGLLPHRPHDPGPQLASPRERSPLAAPGCGVARRRLPDRHRRREVGAHRGQRLPLPRGHGRASPSR